MKSWLPWLLVVGLAAAMAGTYAVSLKKEAELTALRADSEELQKLRAEAEESKSGPKGSESEELARLRKENEELLRLRNEASQLRGEKQRLLSQLQAAQAQAQGAQAQVQAMRANTPPALAPGQSNAAAEAAFRARYGLQAPNPEQAQATLCINNLRMINGAKQQWALQKQKPPGALLTAADLSPFLRSNTLPTCPAGGVYTLNPVGQPPICNIPGHTLPQ